MKESRMKIGQPEAQLLTLKPIVIAAFNIGFMILCTSSSAAAEVLAKRKLAMSVLQALLQLVIKRTA